MLQFFKDQLPPLNLSLAFSRNRSLFKGPFAKGEFITNTAESSHTLETTTATTRSKIYSKGRISGSLAPSRDISPIPFPRSPDIYPEIQYSSRDQTFEQPSRSIRKLPLKLPESGSTGILVRDLLISECQSPDINAYLGYLGYSESASTQNFSTKLKKRIRLRKKSEGSQRPDSIRQFSREQKVRFSVVGATARDEISQVNTHHDNLTERRGTIKSPIPSIFDLDSIKRRSVYRSPSRSSHVMAGDELYAREMAEEVARNYEFYLEKVKRYKKYKEVFEDALVCHGLTKVFKGTVNSDLPLRERIYEDLVEMVEIIPEERPGQKTVMLLGLPIQGPGKVRRYKAKPKMDWEKFERYKKIKKELEEMNTDYKLEEVKTWKEKLSKVNAEFQEKKREVLGRMVQVNMKKYRELKKECRKVEEKVSNMEVMSMDQSDYREPLEPTLNNKINQELEEIMVEWKQNVMELAEDVEDEGEE